jgi:hypothetical protein
MTMPEIQALIVSIGGLLIVLGGGASWLLKHIEAVQAKASLTEATARGALAERLQIEINRLNAQVDRLHLNERVYLRRIYQLESFIHKQPGIDIPAMDGWPPE